MPETAVKVAENQGPPKFDKFHHVSIPCRDLEEGIRFYTEVMGAGFASKSRSLRRSRFPMRLSASAPKVAPTRNEAPNIRTSRSTSAAMKCCK